MNSEKETAERSWQVNIILTAGVMTTVLLALLLAQLDALQVRAELERSGLPIVNIQATAIAAGQAIPLDLNLAGPPTAAPVSVAVGSVPDDLNPRPEFITGVNEEGVIFTVCGAVPEGWLLYTVLPGDTLASLAEGTQTTAADLTGANCLTSDQLTAGMQLLVPQQPVASLCGPPQWWVRYQVRAGDTIASLAVNRGTTVDEVLRANCRDSLDLQVGQLIFLPPGAQPGAAAPIVQPSLTPLPTATAIPTLAPLPTGISSPPPPAQPSPTSPIVIIPTPPTNSPTQPPPTIRPPTQPPPTQPPPTQPPPTQPPPTQPPPTQLPPTQLPPTQPPPTQPPPTQPPPTDPPPTNPPPTDPPPTDPPPTDPPPTDPPPTDPPPTGPPPTDPPPTDPPPPPPDEGD